MRWPWSKREEVIEYQPEEYASPKDAWAYVEQKGKEAEAWRSARASSLKRETPESISISSLGAGYAASEYKGAYRDFLDDFDNAITTEDKIKVFNSHIRSMMSRGWTRRGATRRLEQVLIQHGLVEPVEEY